MGDFESYHRQQAGDFESYYRQQAEKYYLKYRGIKDAIYKLDKVIINLVDSDKQVTITNKILHKRGRGNFKKSLISFYVTLSSFKTVGDIKKFIKESGWPEFNSYKGADIILVNPQAFVQFEVPNTEYSDKTPLRNRYLIRKEVCKLDLYTRDNIKKELTITNLQTNSELKLKVDIRGLYRNKIYKDLT